MECPFSDPPHTTAGADEIHKSRLAGEEYEHCIRERLEQLQFDPIEGNPTKLGVRIWKAMLSVDGTDYDQRPTN